MRDLLHRRLGDRDDRGAVGVLVGVLLGGGVLLGMGALVIDVGRLYQERAELQSGADAAALAVARSCGVGTCTSTAATQLAPEYANANAKDGAATVTQVCGSGTLGSCPASSGTITGCPTAPTAGTNYVDVHTATFTAGGSSLLPPMFARALFGNEAYAGSTVGACSRAAWGAPSAAWTAAFTISACEWDEATDQGTTFAAPPPYPPNTTPSASYSRVLKLHGTTPNTSCPTRPAGSDGPGLFGFTSDSTGRCSVYVSGGTYAGNPGASASGACQTALAGARNTRDVIYIPVFTKLTGTGNNGVYTLEGFAAFVVTGYSLPGFSASDWLNPANNCRGSDKCVNGYFTRGLIPEAEMGTTSTTNLGAVTTTLAG